MLARTPTTQTQTSATTTSQPVLRGATLSRGGVLSQRDLDRVIAILKNRLRCVYREKASGLTLEGIRQLVVNDIDDLHIIDQHVIVTQLYRIL